MNKTTYWGGSSVRDGKVRRLNADTFPDLVSRYVNAPVQFPFTKQEFWAMTDDERNSVKDGPFICPCSFAYENEGRRADEAATQSVLAILDADEGEWIKDIAEHPETLVEALYPYNFVCWHTIKSTPESPRLKIMVDLSPCHPSQHKRIIGFIASRIGAPRDFKGARESGVVSQPQYRPAVMKGADFTAVIASNTTGIPLSLSDLPELDDEDMEMVNGRTYACDPTESEDFYGLAYLPVPHLGVEDVKEALFTINADCGYKMWTEIAAALRHQFTEEEQAREAYESFVEWSSTGTKFKGRRDCYSKWKSFRPYAKGRAPVTIRTLYKYAMDSGWENTKVAAKLSHTVEEWLASTTSKDELLQEGGRRIASLPFKNDPTEESLVNAWRARIKAVSGENIDKSTLKREISKVRKADKKAKVEAQGANNLPSWLRPFVYVACNDEFQNLGNGVALKPTAFDRFFAHYMMPEEIPANGIPPMQPSAYALNIQKILRVEETQYNPTKKEEEKLFTDEYTGRLTLNSYDFLSVPVPDPEHAERAGRLFMQLISPLILEPHLREMMADYMALQCQFPGRKIPWAFLIQSAPGAGKGTLGEVMEAVLGPINVKVISPDMMKAGFNDWARNCVLGIFNEVHMPGDRRDQIMNNIKPLISDKVIAVTVKHKNAECRVQNFVNYLAFSNYRDAAHLAAEDRRWCIIFAPLQTREQVLGLQGTGHFDEIRWLITPEGASALRYFFLKRKISPDFPLTGHAPDTKYRAEVVNASKNQLQIAIEDVIDDATDPLVGREVIHDGRLRELVCRMPKDAAFLTRYLSLMGYERDSRGRVTVDGSRGYLWTNVNRWHAGDDALAFLKKRLKAAPELDEPVFE